MKNLWDIVSAVKVDLDIDSNQYDLKFFKWAEDGYKDATGSNVIKNAFRSQWLPIINHTVQLPEDYVYYFKIGLQRGRHIVNLTANDNIALNVKKVGCCGEELGRMIDHEFDECRKWGDIGQQTGLPYPYSFWDYLPYFKVGQFVAGDYGRGANVYVGGYRIDEGNGEIVLDGCIRADGIILEYKSTGLNGGNAFVPNGCEKALEYYVHWQAALFKTQKDKLSLVNENTFRRRYQRELKKIVARISGLKGYEVLQIVREATYQTVKR